MVFELFYLFIFNHIKKVCIYFLGGSTTIQEFFKCLSLTKEEIHISFSDPDPYHYEYNFSS